MNVLVIIFVSGLSLSVLVLFCELELCDSIAVNADSIWIDTFAYDLTGSVGWSRNNSNANVGYHGWFDGNDNNAPWHLTLQCNADSVVQIRFTCHYGCLPTSNVSVVLGNNACLLYFNDTLHSMPSVDTGSAGDIGFMDVSTEPQMMGIYTADQELLCLRNHSNSNSTHYSYVSQSIVYNHSSAVVPALSSFEVAFGTEMSVNGSVDIAISNISISCESSSNTANTMAPTPTSQPTAHPISTPAETIFVTQENSILSWVSDNFIILGIVVGAVLGLCCLCICIIICLWWKTRTDTQMYESKFMPSAAAISLQTVPSKSALAFEGDSDRRLSANPSNRSDPSTDKPYRPLNRASSMPAADHGNGNNGADNNHQRGRRSVQFRGRQPPRNYNQALSNTNTNSNGSHENNYRGSVSNNSSGVAYGYANNNTSAMIARTSSMPTPNYFGDGRGGGGGHGMPIINDGAMMYTDPRTQQPFMIAGLSNAAPRANNGMRAGGRESPTISAVHPARDGFASPVNHSNTNTTNTNTNTMMTTTMATNMNTNMNANMNANMTVNVLSSMRGGGGGGGGGGMDSPANHSRMRSHSNPEILFEKASKSRMYDQQATQWNDQNMESMAYAMQLAAHQQILFEQQQQQQIQHELNFGDPNTRSQQRQPPQQQRPQPRQRNAAAGAADREEQKAAELGDRRGRGQARNRGKSVNARQQKSARNTTTTTTTTTKIKSGDRNKQKKKGGSKVVNRMKRSQSAKSKISEVKSPKGKGKFKKGKGKGKANVKPLNLRKSPSAKKANNKNKNKTKTKTKTKTKANMKKKTTMNKKNGKALDIPLHTKSANNSPKRKKTVTTSPKTMKKNKKNLHVILPKDIKNVKQPHSKKKKSNPKKNSHNNKINQLSRQRTAPENSSKNKTNAKTMKKAGKHGNKSKVKKKLSFSEEDSDSDVAVNQQPWPLVHKQKSVPLKIHAQANFNNNNSMNNHNNNSNNNTNFPNVIPMNMNMNTNMNMNINMYSGGHPLSPYPHSNRTRNQMNATVNLSPANNYDARSNTFVAVPPPPMEVPPATPIPESVRSGQSGQSSEEDGESGSESESGSGSGSESGSGSGSTSDSGSEGSASGSAALPAMGGMQVSNMFKRLEQQKMAQLNKAQKLEKHGSRSVSVVDVYEFDEHNDVNDYNHNKAHLNAEHARDNTGMTAMTMQTTREYSVSNHESVEVGAEDEIRYVLGHLSDRDENEIREDYSDS